jgi:response regulator RpfG family c-di-GMP phosphodiesterase
MNCEVVGEAKTGSEAIELYRQLKPHMLLLDVNMPNKTGDEVLQEIRAEFPLAFVIIVTRLPINRSSRNAWTSGRPTTFARTPQSPRSRARSRRPGRISSQTFVRKSRYPSAMNSRFSPHLPMERRSDAARRPRSDVPCTFPSQLRPTITIRISPSSARCHPGSRRVQERTE